MEFSVIDNPFFWICAVFAVITTGISKGGLGGLGIFAVPVMSLAISPVQAAAIMLPILIVMDWMSVAAYRKTWDKSVLLLTLPGAIIGIAIGGFLARYINEDFVRFAVAVIALGFVAYAVTKEFILKSDKLSALKGNRPLGFIAGTVAGFTSFIAHAGGPPFQAFAIPQGLEKRVYAGTSVMFFTVVNAVKLLPYAMLGQFDKTNLSTSLLLIPLAPIGVLIGVWLIKRIDERVFFRVLYALLVCVGIKLLFDVFA
jgi:uncharacterized membrane protein YfcA